MRPWAWRTQLSIFFAAYVLYDAARWIFASDPDRARVHAEWIIDLERSVHVAVEGPVQSALDSGAPIWILSNVYLAAQLVVLPGALWMLHRKARPAYARLRNTVLATWLLSIPIYGLFPVAPPRLAGIGLVDTISSQTGFAMDSSLTTSFYNELAAVPSLHVGFAFAVGIAVASASSNRALKVAGHLWGPIVALAVVATGNHYVFDIVAGMIAAAIGYGLGTLVAKGTRPAV